MNTHEHTHTHGAPSHKKGEDLCILATYVAHCVEETDVLKPDDPPSFTHTTVRLMRLSTSSGALFRSIKV
eukprot:5803377-Pyramimonas_sp.AAC.1